MRLNREGRMMRGTTIAKGVIAYIESVELIAESSVEDCVDLGHAMLYKLVHPQHGRLIVVSSAIGACGLLKL